MLFVALTLPLVSRCHEQAGIPACQQRLVLGAKQLEEGRTLGDYNVQKVQMASRCYFLFCGRQTVASGFGYAR